MLSNKTLLELIRLADSWGHPEINRVLSIFGVPRLNPLKKTTVTAKATEIFHFLKLSAGKGPFTDSAQIDFLQYLVEDFFNKRPFYESGTIAYNGDGTSTKFDNAFSLTNKQLANTLKRDGYIVVGRTIKKLLPEEIEEAKTESELMSALDGLGFIQSKGHLDQAISNHTQGNWAGANSQFRTFIESLLIEIAFKINSVQRTNSAGEAIEFLAEDIEPPFLSKELNEYPKTNTQDSFIYGFWKRLHPDGSHPGLSDEDDSSFRYHMTIVVANYFLRRLRTRNFSASTHTPHQL